MSDTKWVYSFGDGSAEGSAEMKNLLGGKGANLAEMCRLGLPVPPGLTITTEVCSAFYDNDRNYPDGLDSQLNDALTAISKAVGSDFGNPENPLLVSVRSGARASMPGMMDTVLNLGMNDATVAGLAKRAGDERFAWDSYRRFIQMYSDVVLGVGHDNFEEILDDYKMQQGHYVDTDLTAEDWQYIVTSYKQRVNEVYGADFPQDVMEQLWGAVGAVFGSWRNARAETYRRLNNIPESWGTAVNVQAMVFGNLGPTSATGVAFTRNPSTGENALYGEFLVNAQGEDVVAGIRTPQNLTKIAREEAGSDMPSMEEVMPEVFGQLVDVNLKLENHYRDMQDIEFTVQDGKLWMLQTRSGKRTTAAALKIAVDMVAEGLITKDEAVLRIDPMSLDQLLHPMLDPDAKFDIIASGLPASPGAASGAVVFSADEAEKAKADGRKVILVRMETSPEDIHGMHAAEGILTSRGGMTSHAAVVARGMGRPCVSGAGSVRIDYDKQEFQVAGVKVGVGETITLDGGTGRVMAGEVPTRQPELSGDFASLIAWADDIRRMRVRTNAETPADAATAIKFGAEGIGLCRTEHMFFDANRIMAVREMILAETPEDRAKPLERILPMQRDDFTELFTIMTGMPVTIRLLDPPLHEFLPQNEEDILQVAAAIGMTQDKLKRRIRELEEVNPMLGHRGCRMGLTYPEIYEMQARAIFEAAINVAKTSGSTVVPEVMIPLVADHSELKELATRIERIAQDVIQEQSAEIDYLIGTMIELPRAALRAADIAQTAKFFSFGTNDLTQTTFGISRDDAASFMEPYLSRGLFEYDPFVSLDQDGVGELVEIAVERGRSARDDLKLGICGEHGGDPASIAFCEKTGLDYVSCSPYRVPIARLAAAQSYLQARKKS
ncbi:pyruvate, phosphate dikinase [alpha proteobacterium IMCC14465]|uniref:Pyruvate, phosphate dikinase n=1 Tax=alpha proteobacterium IMCC14465 TaxID=1220535 RepID=J9DWK9_9PROT|nr:pyruvate, phosphate dikinase [alpha proteobacterium IMCC14465]